MLHLSISETHAEFLHADRLAGRYNYRDAFKPYFDPFTTPLGYSLTLVSPNDHRHHKGLMFAVRTARTNFWEENVTRDGETVGRQVHDRFDDVTSSGERVGFVETLRWRDLDSGKVVFDESREIRLRLRGGAFCWTWKSVLTPREDVVLIQSQWSHGHDDGSRTNYHGLGIRLRREFGGPTGRNRIRVDGEAQEAGDFALFMRRTPERVTFTGTLDGVWPQRRASVTMGQGTQQRHALFVMNQAFAFMSLGPSNLAELPLRASKPLSCAYEVAVADGDSDAPDTEACA